MPAESAASPKSVTIRYRRLPDREQIFRQALVEDAGDHIVTLHPGTPLPKPMRVGGEVVLEAASPVVWFTYPGGWHDVGRFHRADGTWTGLYANVLTPVVIQGREWTTTDLCLDVWLGADGRCELLDEDEFADAVRHGWIDVATADRARREADALIAGAANGSWPPEHVHRWTLERARARLPSFAIGS